MKDSENQNDQFYCLKIYKVYYRCMYNWYLIFLK